MTIRAAADGSALGNPGPAGWAWYVDDNCWAAGGWKHATNNQGELMAVLQFFRATAHLSDDLLILCDSQYVINCITKWMPGWKKKGWKKADGKPVMNVDLLKDIDAAIVGRKYRFEWVKGHANHPLNEAADSRARAVSEAYQRGKPIPTGPGWVREGDVTTAGSAADTTGHVPPIDPGTPTDGIAAPAAVPGATAAARAALKASKAAAAARPEEPGLFDLDDIRDEPVRAVTATLTAEQHRKLAAAAARQGVSIEEALARLV
jgi:ribonuclease HI